MVDLKGVLTVVQKETPMADLWAEHLVDLMAAMLGSQTVGKSAVPSVRRWVAPMAVPLVVLMEPRKAV